MHKGSVDILLHRDMNKCMRNDECDSTVKLCTNYSGEGMDNGLYRLHTAAHTLYEACTG